MVIILHPPYSLWYRSVKKYEWVKPETLIREMLIIKFNEFKIPYIWAFIKDTWRHCIKSSIIRISYDTNVRMVTDEYGNSYETHDEDYQDFTDSDLVPIVTELE